VHGTPVNYRRGGTGSTALQKTPAALSDGRGRADPHHASSSAAAVPLPLPSGIWAFLVFVAALGAPAPAVDKGQSRGSMRYVKDAEYTSPAAYTGDVDISGIWNVPLAQLERDRPPTW